MADDDEIRPYRIEIPDERLADLHDRIARVRWAPEPVGGDEGYGVPVARVRELAEHWRDRYDWRAVEARLLPSIRAFSEHHHANIVSWNHYERGGHYAAHDAPDLLVDDIRRFFAAVRG